MPLLDTRPKASKQPMTPSRTRPESDDEGDTAKSPKKARKDIDKPPPSLHAWLHPDQPPPLRTHSPALHSSTSTFLSFSMAFEPPAYITTETALAKEARRIVRELDVPTLVGAVVMKDDEGAFQNGEGRASGSKGKGKERCREPDHRMWAVRTLCLKERRDGTGGEDDYQLLETYNDDGEKFGGERVLRVLREGKGVDVLTVCCRWYGGDMLGPIRFQHIGVTANTSLTSLLKLVQLRDLRITLSAMDDEIADMRNTLNPPGSPLQSVDATSTPPSQTNGNGVPKEKGKYEDITDVARLERLIKAKEKTKASLVQKVAWVAMEQNRAEEEAAGAQNGA